MGLSEVTAPEACSKFYAVSYAIRLGFAVTCAAMHIVSALDWVPKVYAAADVHNYISRF